MYQDNEEKYRPLLDENPPPFIQRVDTPWNDVPDLAEHNAKAYRKLERTLRSIRRQNESLSANALPVPAPSLGILILGESGTGKTHLLMRVAKNLSDKNHILFVRKPNSIDTLCQHIWQEIVSSLSENLPNTQHQQSQLDDLLAHVFCKVLIPEFQNDIKNQTGVAQREKWISSLNSNPFNLFRMLGTEEQRTRNMRAIRNRTLRYLQINQPKVDQKIAHALITYCFTVEEDRKRLLLTWLAGEDISDDDAKKIGLPATWIEIDETSNQTSIQQQREELALKAIRSIGILSTYYQPLILAFDQLEGLYENEPLTRRFGDVTREIFTMAPNLLIVTCAFPSRWSDWFLPKLDTSASDRIANSIIELEKLSAENAVPLLKKLLESTTARLQLPTSIFPYTEQDVATISAKATSPRMFIKEAKEWFEAWLDGDDPDQGEPIISVESARRVIEAFYGQVFSEQDAAYTKAIPVERDLFERIENVVRTVLNHSDQKFTFTQATCDKYVMPPNFIVKSDDTAVCIAVMNGIGNSFAARLRNLRKTFEEGAQFDNLIIIRDRRCKSLGAKGQQYLTETRKQGASYFLINRDEMVTIDTLYECLVAIEEHDLLVGTREIDKQELADFVRSEELLGQSQFIQQVISLALSFAHAISGYQDKKASPHAGRGITSALGSGNNSIKNSEHNVHTEDNRPSGPTELDPDVWASS